MLFISVNTLCGRSTKNGQVLTPDRKTKEAVLLKEINPLINPLIFTLIPFPALLEPRAFRDSWR